MKTIGKFSRWLALLSAIWVFFSPLALRAEGDFLAESEAIDLSVDAFSGSRKALKALAREYRKYIEEIKAGRALSAPESALFLDIEETLRLLSPSSVVAVAREGIVRQKAGEGMPMAHPETALDPDRPEDLLVRYFIFRDGESSIYSCRKKDFAYDAWVPADKILKVHTLRIQKTKDGQVRVETLREIFSRQEQWLEDQTFAAYLISWPGVRIHKRSVFSKPAPGTISPIGEQEPYWIARFPLKENDRFQGFQVLSVTSTVKTPAGLFNHCLEIRGLAERWIFSPSSGPVVMEVFDEQWSLKEKRIPKDLPVMEISAAERKALEKKIRASLKKSGARFDRLLSLRSDAQSCTVRLLAGKKDNQDPDHERYQIIEQKWFRKIPGDGTVWELREEP